MNISVVGPDSNSKSGRVTLLVMSSEEDLGCKECSVLSRAPSVCGILRPTGLEPGDKEYLAVSSPELPGARIKPVVLPLKVS